MRNRDSFSLMNMMGTPHPIKCGDDTYYLSPLGLNEMAELEAWAKRKPYEDLKKKVEYFKEAGLGAEHIVNLVKSAEEQANDPKQRAATIESLEGIKYALYLAFKIKHSKMDHKTFEHIVRTNSLELLQTIMEGQNNIPTEPGDAKNQ